MTKLTLTHEQRVQLYTDIIQTKLKSGLNDFIVATMRNKAPSQVELDALNAALVQLGWEK
jgi:hypothetical protein